MSVVDNVYIKGFWGDHLIDISFREDFNFIVGVNGSGKSTFLNLLAGVFRADIKPLSKYEFEYIRIELKDLKTKRKPCIEVRKDLSLPFFEAQYKIWDSSSDKPFSYTLSEVDSFESRVSSGSLKIRMQLPGSKSAGRSLKEHLDELLNLTWLSVHRSETVTEKRIEPLDAKLEDLFNRLVRYLSSLSRQVNRLYEGFQEQIFLSLLSVDDVSGAKIPSKSKIEKERLALIQIFNQFQMGKSKHLEEIKNKFDVVEKVISRVQKGGISIAEDTLQLFALQRIERAVDSWEKVTKEKNEILAPRNVFLKLLNELMQRKSLDFSERNELEITTQSGKMLTPFQLSSGEKQMLIILGEALLQENKSYIYMADEPELSLHVEWQEKLAEYISLLNPSAQVIFATHSPDVISIFQEKVMHMEDCIS
ncbi:AAA family ATPase [Pseudomonas syringae pv. syringae]|uniref:AAA family ATPase n=1 Tax=Pseudomonas syringae TaxID=317 RepID=UPI0023422F5B|nr:AAA family ATPase [Pseudomonas syringae]MDC3741324.1 AAA family ATPase [Pseudomonas syringae pv. syringae]